MTSPDNTSSSHALTTESIFQRDLRSAINERGGLFNAHLHLDRAGSLETVLAKLDEQSSGVYSAISLQSKHSLVSVAHNSGHYEPEALKSRTRKYLDDMFKIGTSRATTTVDITADSVGMSAFRSFVEVKNIVKDRLRLDVGAYSPLGFRDDEPERWELISKAAQECDLFIALPERDDHSRYPEHIGFHESVRRFLEIGYEHGKPVHIHSDQENHQHESASEDILSILEKSSFHVGSGFELWLIHMISPSAYPDSRFESLVKRLTDNQVGVIVCPSAALSMRQVRPFAGPMRNSIARVLELLAAGVRVRLGSDNVNDITSPAGTLDLMQEVFVLSHALRFFDISVLSALASGSELTDSERNTVHKHLKAHSLEERNLIEYTEQKNRNF